MLKKKSIETTTTQTTVDSPFIEDVGVQPKSAIIFIVEDISVNVSSIAILIVDKTTAINDEKVIITNDSIYYIIKYRLDVVFRDVIDVKRRRGLI